ncbi:hypothetical protein D3H55_00840 [Bacillus salacetis]|uniref:Uncharacterized protein n=1 Tax=Bacillus salacetis TaxID=2315464 RepID=A0A3A1R7R6_9BACI|nr:hypothetical protein D3H55_00840 [Bacillus salacetis]
MLFPTVSSEVFNKIHAIRDKESTECGYKYSHFYESKKRMLKDIRFREINEITCPKCKDTVRYLN